MRALHHQFIFISSADIQTADFKLLSEKQPNFLRFILRETQTSAPNLESRDVDPRHDHTRARANTSAILFLYVAALRALQSSFLFMLPSDLSSVQICIMLLLWAC